MLNQKKIVNIIGAGLAGCEAAYFLAEHNIYVRLFEMKNIKKTPAQKLDSFAELVCSNSLKSTEKLSASGMLKAELETLGSFLLECAYKTKVPSGNSLSVDREEFSKLITKKIKNHKNIEIIDKVVESFDTNLPTIIATGPLCDDKLFSFIKDIIGDENCYFYDAIAPIIETDSVDMSRAFWANRYDHGETKDYLNCWLTKQEFDIFYEELISAKQVELKSFEKLKVFEGCMPIEVLAKRGKRSLLFGPMKPVGLSQKVQGEKPCAIVQLRKENQDGSYVNMVGFQTNLLFGEQKRVFSLIPALRDANFIRFGTMHRNSYICAPVCLTEFSSLKKYPNIFIAGQISGVEGYMESIASGLFCAINMLQYICGEEMQTLPSTTCLGAMINYITTAAEKDFQPMNANYGIIVCEKTFSDKQQKRQYMFEKSMQEIQKFKENTYGKYI